MSTDRTIVMDLNNNRGKSRLDMSRNTTISSQKVQTSKLSVVIASPEIAPYAKTGGLGDVIRSLPGALAKQGIHVSLIMPAYRSVLTGQYTLEDTGIRLSVQVSNRQEEATVLKTKTADGLPLFFIRADRYFDREDLYSTPDGDYSDNSERFIFFCRALLEVIRQDPPDILHVNDWQTALAVAFLKSQPYLYPELTAVKTVLTIHNLGYQGLFSGGDWHLLNLDRYLFTPRYLEFYGKINLLKAGIVFADAITTVSPTYCQEIMTTEQGFGLEGVFQERIDKVFGILNGIDYDLWNPETDRLIPQNYTANNRTGKAICKEAIQKHFNLIRDLKIPLISMVTRLSSQKGVDLVATAMEGLLRRGCQFVLLGSGDRASQELFRNIATSNRHHVGVEIVFSETLAHRIIAGSDMLLMPSRYEPGGLTQLYALRYGTIPVVRATGGLKDTVTEFQPDLGKGNGFLFSLYEEQALLAAVDRALSVFRRPVQWESLVLNAMPVDFSWTTSAKGYLDIYRKLTSEAISLSK
jgi:starch synthase